MGTPRSLLRSNRQPDRLTSRSLATGFGILLIVSLSGCASNNSLKQTCRTPDPTLPASDIRYRVGCPDVLEINFVDHPERDVYTSVDLEGRLPLDFLDYPRVEGLTLDEIRDLIAKRYSMNSSRVEVLLADPRSNHVFIHGPVRNRTRIIAYKGPETVIDFLRRNGGLPPGSKLDRVYVVRPNVAIGHRPEYYRVDIHAILIEGDSRTNVQILPSDQIYIGETRCSAFSRLLPNWLGEPFRKLVGLLPDDWWPFANVRELDKLQ